MSQMDLFVPLLATTDTKKKLALGNDIINYLDIASNDIECEDIGAFVDGVVPWMNQSNFRVSQNGLEILGLLVDRMKAEFRPFVNVVLPHAVDRLGDARDTVREKAHILLIKLMLATVTPQQLFDKLTPAFSHKSAKVREEVLVLLQNALADHGAKAIHLSPLVAPVVRLLSDATADVRDAAFNTLVEMYKHVGERLRHDLQQKHTVPPARLPPLMKTFDEVRDSGQLKATAQAAPPAVDGARRDGSDEMDEAATKTSVLRSTSAPPVRRTLPQKPSSGAANGAAPAPAAGECRPAAGAIDEATFISSFEQVPRVQLFSPRDLEEVMVQLRETISRQGNAWDVRTEALKKLRGVLMAGGANFDELYQHLRLMEPALQLTVQDLRSQVVREGCITIAYLSQQLGHRVDHVCHSLLPYLIELIPNSAKVMSTSGVVAIRFIIQNTPYARLIPIITGQMTSKSRDIRRACCEFLDQMITSWPTQVLEKHVAAIQEAIRRGVSDADGEARAASRRAYWGFADHFKEQADSLLNSLDPQHKKMLAGEMTKSGSNNSLTGLSGGRAPSAVPGSRSRTSSRSGSQENLQRAGSVSRRPTVAASPAGRQERGESPGQQASFRSTSAIDLQAAQRARVRAQYAAAQRMRVGTGMSLPRGRRQSTGTPSRGPPPAAAPTPNPARTPRTRSRSGVTQSQPGSRSGSPSSRLSYATYTATASPGDSQTLGRRRRRSGIPRSTSVSRDPSPHRAPAAAAASGLRARPSAAGAEQLTGLHRPVMGHRPPPSRDAESGLADTPASTRSRPPRPFDDRSDESETSSVCSERSYDSASRRDYLGGWPGGSHGQQSNRLRSVPDPSGRDVGEVIDQIASTQWSERKEGLLSLRAVLRSNRMLTGSELRRITELFTKMFMDAHTKVFSIFLEALEELVVQHHDDLADWLYILITRLLNKSGADLLRSVSEKIDRTLATVRCSFPPSQQLHCICRFLLDQTQTPNTKVKAATLRYLRALLDTMDPAEFTADADLPLAVTKIIGWTTDQKSVETRNCAKSVIVAMFDLNTAEFTMLLSQLSKLYQDTASEIMQQHVRRRASVDRSAALLRARSPASPLTPTNGGWPRGPSRPSANPDNAENLNPEELHRSLRRTTAEIQSFSFDGVDGAKRERDSTSQDSGISQVSAERRGSPAARAAPAAAEPAADEAQLAASVLAELNTERPAEPAAPERRAALLSVCRLAKVGSERLWAEHFRTLLRLLLDNLRDGPGPVRELVLSALTEMLRRDCIAPHFHPFIELVFLRVLDAHREPSERDVTRAAEQCAAVMAGRLPADSVVRVLNPLIQTGEFPVNQAAIKTLTRLMEQHSRELVAGCLPDVMPSLLKAYDNSESSVRKAAVFCMVTIHTLCGEEAMRPHLASLNATKMKLLSLYIKRAQSSPGSPRTNPGSPK